MVNDLWNLGIKGPRRYEFHPPLKHLDKEGMKAFLRGSFLETVASLLQKKAGIFAYPHHAKNV